MFQIITTSATRMSSAACATRISSSSCVTMNTSTDEAGVSISLLWLSEPEVSSYLSPCNILTNWVVKLTSNGNLLLLEFKINLMNDSKVCVLIVAAQFYWDMSFIVLKVYHKCTHFPSIQVFWTIFSKIRWVRVRRHMTWILSWD